ncbi:hypothetical protein GSI_15383 [Ganoderma sinense ZZ0214-1]|uniref:Uncharacterized protein n=1 Tax=Ganoderma sinense ZZ0214-1 TaxID=1077348 RepID=A0A2G8RMG0_9APHY|nr:hypothetical protein GSI_15383 [Ganoderma sinense ZZ0214-1]
MRTQDDRQIRRQFKQSSPIIRLDHLQPFFKFVNLTLFRFSVASLYELDNTAYSAFAQAWSQIRSFEVGQGKLCVHLQPPAMREVLVPFAIHCPKLVHLSVRFSGRNMDVLANGGIENPIP